MHIGEATIENVHAVLATPYPFMAWLAAQPKNRIVGTDVHSTVGCPMHAFLADCFHEELETPENNNHNFGLFVVRFDDVSWGGSGFTLGRHAFTMQLPPWAGHFQRRMTKENDDLHNAYNNGECDELPHDSITAGAAMRIMRKVLAKEQKREARERIEKAA